MDRGTEELAVRKYPTGMLKKNGCYFLRDRRGGGDKLRTLGKEYPKAKLLYRELKGRRFEWSEAETIALFAERWLKEYVATSRNEKELRLATQRIRDHLNPQLGEKLIAELSMPDIRQYRLRLEEKMLSPQSVRNILSDLRCLLLYATREAGVIPRSPFVSSILPRIPERDPSHLNEQEIDMIFDSIPDRYRALVTVGLHTGLRFGELRALRWSDVVELPDPHLVVAKSHEGPTKSRKLRRVPISDEVRSVLRDLPTRGEYVFSGIRGERLAGDAGAIARAVRKSSGIDDFRFHRLRHSFARRWLDEGRSMETLQKVLGHSSIRQTERYGRISDSTVFAEAKKEPRTVTKTVTNHQSPLTLVEGRTT